MIQRGKKSLAILLDPDKLDTFSIQERIEDINHSPVDYLFIGGSLISSANMDILLNELAAKTFIPKILFPGNSLHINDKADAILFLSLISGRNPEFLIGQQVVSAPILKRSNLKILPTGYMLIDGGRPTSVSYMSNTTPIPNDKPDLAAVTALAGEMLGLQHIYLDAGSGALFPVSAEMIKAVRENISLPLIVGGGIKTAEAVKTAFEAGADVVVIGNAIEENPSLYEEMAAFSRKYSTV